MKSVVCGSYLAPFNTTALTLCTQDSLIDLFIKPLNKFLHPIDKNKKCISTLKSMFILKVIYLYTVGYGILMSKSNG